MNWVNYSMQSCSRVNSTLVMHVVSCDVRLTTSIPSRLVKIVSMDLFEMQYLYAA